MYARRYTLFETNSMVEEMMLLANEAVAAKIFSAFPACAMLRNHPVPHPNMLVPLQNLAALFKIPLDTRSNKVNVTQIALRCCFCHILFQTLAASLSAVSDPNDPFVSKVRRTPVVHYQIVTLHSS